MRKWRLPEYFSFHRWLIFCNLMSGSPFLSFWSVWVFGCLFFRFGYLLTRAFARPHFASLEWSWSRLYKVLNKSWISSCMWALLQLYSGQSCFQPVRHLFNFFKRRTTEVSPASCKLFSSQPSSDVVETATSCTPLVTLSETAFFCISPGFSMHLSFILSTIGSIHSFRPPWVQGVEWAHCILLHVVRSDKKEAAC